jgi:hypothetical protein
LAIGGLALLAGCGPKDQKATTAPESTKWKGLPYRLAFDAPPAKPNPAGVTLPPIKFTADPESLETRAVLVVRFDASSATKTESIANQMIMPPTDISGAAGALPADYIEMADKDLGRFFTSYCMKGKVKISVALARSSLSRQTTEADVDQKRLSDWAPAEVDFKNPHGKC